MAKSRIILTKFWDDEYVLENLNNSEKLTFLYLFTNPETTICGIYEISIKTAELRLGIPSEKIGQHLSKFEADGKVIYRKPYIYIKNFIKNQKPNPSILKGIINSFNEIPQKVFQTLNIQKDTFFGNNDDNSLFINGNFRQSVPSLSPVCPQSVPDSPQSATKGIGIGIGIGIGSEIENKEKENILKEKFLHKDYVYLTEEEFNNLNETFGSDKTETMIDDLNSYIRQIGVKKANAKYISHYSTILNWERKDQKETERRIKVAEHLQTKKEDKYI